MRAELGEIKGDLRLTDQLDLCGAVTGTITVATGGVLSLRGVCGGNLIVEPGGKASVEGMVGGSAVNHGGELSVNGMVAGFLQAEKGQTFLGAAGKVIGGLHGTVILTCGSCGQHLNVPTDRGELTLTCPKCKASWPWSPVQHGTATAGAPVQRGFFFVPDEGMRPHSTATAGAPVQHGETSRPQSHPGLATTAQVKRIISLLWWILAVLLLATGILGAVIVRLMTG